MGKHDSTTKKKPRGTNGASVKAVADAFDLPDAPGEAAAAPQPQQQQQGPPDYVARYDAMHLANSSFVNTPSETALLKRATAIHSFLMGSGDADGA